MRSRQEYAPLSSGLQPTRLRVASLLNFPQFCSSEHVEIPRLTVAERDARLEGGEAWLDRHVGVRGWSERTRLRRELVEEGVRPGEVKAAFLARLETRSEGWVLLMLRDAHVLKGARNGG